MASDLTPAEARFVRALCAGGPLGIAALGLSRVLGVTTGTVGNLALIVERKGFCTRERYGMRVFFRPTSAALLFAATPAPQTLQDSCFHNVTRMGSIKSRVPRVPRR
jgi:hypothetical protein